MKPTEVLRILGRDGWIEDHQHGSHKVLVHPTKPGRVIVPGHKRDIPTGTLADIFDSAGLTVDDVRRLR